MGTNYVLELALCTLLRDATKHNLHRRLKLQRESKQHTSKHKSKVSVCNSNDTCFCKKNACPRKNIQNNIM